MSFGEVAEKTRAPAVSLRDEIKNEIFNANKMKESLKYNKKILISGANGTGKSTLALRLLCNDLKEDEIIVYMDIDNSGAEVISTIFAEELEAGQILYWSPSAQKDIVVDKTKITVRDEEGIVNRTITASASISDALEEGYKVKGIIIDGVSFLLEYAEAKMRLERNLDADQGTNINVWKIRNKFFRDFSSPYMAMPLPVIFVSHDDFIQKEGEHELASVKKRFIEECSIRIETYEGINNKNTDIHDYYAIIKKDRSNVRNVGSRFVFLSINKKEYKEGNSDTSIDECSKDISDTIFYNTQ